MGQDNEIDWQNGVTDKKEPAYLKSFLMFFYHPLSVYAIKVSDRQDIWGHGFGYTRGGVSTTYATCALRYDRNTKIFLYILKYIKSHELKSMISKYFPSYRYLGS